MASCLWIRKCWAVLLLSVIALPSFAAVSPSVIPQIDPARLQKDEIPPPHRLREGTPTQIAKPAVKKPVSEKAKQIVFVLKDVKISGVTVYSSEVIKTFYQKYLNKKISIATLHEITQEITKKYRADGYILSRAFLPAQKIRAGIVKIHIIEGFVDKIKIQGSAGRASKILEDYGHRIARSRPLQMKTLERYTLLASDLTGLRVRSVLAASPSVKGAADLTWIVRRQPVKFAVGYNNTASRYVGPEQLNLSVQLNTLLGTADSWIIDVVGTPQNDEMRSIQLDYGRPLGTDGLYWTVLGGYTETKPGFVLSSDHLVGRSPHFFTSLEYPVVRTRRKNLSLDFGFDWLDSQSVLPITTLYADHIRSLYFRMTFDRQDGWYGYNVGNIKLTKGLPALGASARSPAIPLSRQDGRSDFTKVVVTVSRTQNFPSSRFSFKLFGEGQYAFNPLLSSEEMGIGGQMYGRGYDSSEITGDSGIVGHLELKYTARPATPYIQYLQPYIFYDMGKVWNRPTADQIEHQSLASTGIGLRWGAGKYFTGYFMLAKPLTRDVRNQVQAGKSGKALRGFFSLTMALP